MYQHIVVPMDGSKLAEGVLPHVVAIAGGCNVARVTLVRVVAPFHLYDYAEEKLPPKEKHQLEVKATDDASEYLKGIATQLKKKGVAAECEVLTGDVVKRLVNYADENDVDLFVISTHGRSDVSQMVWGSVAESLLRASRIPVLMVTAKDRAPSI
jgi:nucleotide-binding universal stress UspA family protein